MRFYPLRSCALLLAFVAIDQATFGADVQVTVDTAANRTPVSPSLYGKNGGLSDDPANPLKESDWQLLRDAGVKLIRDHGGNNGTKYNWQKKLTSHPDWYNNVYAHDWDFAQTSLQQNLPGVKGFWAFQMIGKVASNTQNNFSDWNYNQSQWWSGTVQNLAGGGTPKTSGGGKAAVEGNPSLYLEDSTPETDTAILDHWIKPSGLGLDRTAFPYWNMDNEPEIWNGTHDDVMPVQPSAEAFMQRYFAYAKAARARFPEIKLLGPVSANEWQWFNWASTITSGGKTYSWLEYFIKRIGEEQAATGIRLLDVLDLHFYPGDTNPATVVQLHRVFFDTTYDYPGANGVHAVNGSWDSSITKEYVFGRCAAWLEQYLGKDHGVTFGLSETGLAVTDPKLVSVWYASTMGEFMKHGVEVFTPWNWPVGMWETLHLYSRYNYGTCVKSDSSDETNVSAYTTHDAASGNVTVVLVNRHLTAQKSVAVSIAGATIPDGSYTTLQLSGLPSTETFVSHSQNALVQGTATVASGSFTVNLPALSVTSVLLRPHAEVTPTPAPSRLVNLSVRSESGAGGDVFIVGFYVKGTAAKSLLVRGIGPTLSVFGISNPMPDPTMRFYDSKGVLLDSNDNWADNGLESALTTVFSNSGAFPLSPTSLDAALALNLATGSYTVHISDKNGAAGISLGEVYDANVNEASQLLNVSARSRVNGANSALIAGFAISGEAPKKVLIRAVGPGLSPFIPNGLLADPKLSVYRQSISLPLYQNQSWSDVSYSDEVNAKRVNVGAFEIPSGSKDAALLLTLPPGVYSAVVSSADDTSGIALVEVYDAD